jgi:hypothetical protein
VLELKDLEDRALDVDVIAVFELVGAYQGGSVLTEPNVDVVTDFAGYCRARSR